MSDLLFADAAVLNADSEECMHRMVIEIEVVFGRIKLKVNEKEKQVMKVFTSGEYGVLKVHLNGERIEEVELDCLGTMEWILDRIEKWKQNGSTDWEGCRGFEECIEK